MYPLIDLKYFYPRPPRGGRPPFHQCRSTTLDISIHALREEGDHGEIIRAVFLARFLSTPSARRATLDLSSFSTISIISIHALREEGDAVHGPENLVDAISIHALREEGDWAGRAHPSCKGYFYPRPPRGGRRAV